MTLTELAGVTTGNLYWDTINIDIIDTLSLSLLYGKLSYMLKGILLLTDYFSNLIKILLGDKT